MTNSSIIAQVNEIMHSGFEIPVEKLSPEANLFSDLGLDSLDAIDMLVHLEERLGVKVDGEKLMQVRTLQDVYTMIEELTPA
jgi:acyl carrier protein